MIRARAALVLDHPFFGSIALRLTLKPDPSCDDLWTDGRTLGFNPSYAAALSDAALMGAQAHEIMHLACAHHVRREGRDATLWNKACDFVVNQLLLDAGFSLPQGAMHDPAYAGLSVEALYSKLTRLQDEAPNSGTGSRHRTRSGHAARQAHGRHAGGISSPVPKATPPHSGLAGHPSALSRKLRGRRLHMDNTEPSLSLPRHLPAFAPRAPDSPYRARRGQFRFRGRHAS